MEITYELWDTGTGNVVGSFETLDEGLTLVRYLLDSYGRGCAEEFDLGRRENDGSVTMVATGDQLIELAERSSNEADRGATTVTQTDR